MATRTHVETVCDLTHTKVVRGQGEEMVEEPATHEINLVINGRSFRIDVCDSHQAAFDKAVGPFTEDRLRYRQHPAMGRVIRRAASRQAVGPDAATIRQWAKENGFEINDRGRVSAPVREAYLASNGAA